MKNKYGFTLLEIILTLTLMSFFVTVGVMGYIDLSKEAKQKKIYQGVGEYNSREELLWGKTILSQKFETVNELDRYIYDNMDPYLDPGHSYESGTVSENGKNWTYVHKSYGNAATGTSYKGTLNFQGVTANLERTPATFEGPAIWTVTSFIED